MARLGRCWFDWGVSSPCSGGLAVGDLFARRPVQFGLRSDVYLWEALGMEFSRTPLPSSWFELRRLIVESIERTIGQPLAPTEDHDASVYVADFDPGHGMSAGHVHLAWWLKTGIPIVIDRFEGVLAEPASG